MDLPIGHVYAGKYRLLRMLGQGAMGAVYEAENVHIQRRVAIKFLHPGLAHRPDTIQRFENEAQAAGRIGSNHIVEVLDIGEIMGGTRFMVMELLQGTTLDQRIRSNGRLPPEHVSRVVAELLDGLSAAHAASIIHRDLKPANVFLSAPNDFVKILDFGVSKFNVLNEHMSMTKTGAVLGTPFYMSPEQAKGSKGVDARSDLYSVGVILYEAITGQVPFSAETFNELIFRIVLESPAPAEAFVPNLDPAFAQILRRSMAREPEGRFQNAQEFRHALLAWQANAPRGRPQHQQAQQQHGLAGTMVMDGGVGYPGGGYPAGGGFPGVPAASHGLGGTVVMDDDDDGPTRLHSRQELMDPRARFIPASPPIPQHAPLMQGGPGQGFVPAGAYPQGMAPAAAPRRSNGVVVAVLAMVALGVVGGTAAALFARGRATAANEAPAESGAQSGGSPAPSNAEASGSAKATPGATTPPAPAKTAEPKKSEGVRVADLPDEEEAKPRAAEKAAPPPPPPPPPRAPSPPRDTHRPETPKAEPKAPRAEAPKAEPKAPKAEPKAPKAAATAAPATAGKRIITTEL